MRILESSRVGTPAGSSIISRYSIPKAGSRLILGVGLFLLSVSTIAYQDVAGFGSNIVADDMRWTAHAVHVPTGSTYAARFGEEVDRLVTGTVQHRLKVETLGDTGSTPSSVRQCIFLQVRLFEKAVC